MQDLEIFLYPFLKIELEKLGRKSGRKFGMIHGEADCKVQENKNQEGQGSMDLQLSHNARIIYPKSVR